MRMAAQPTLKLSPASRPRTANGSTTRRNISGKPRVPRHTRSSGSCARKFRKSWRSAALPYCRRRNGGSRCPGCTAAKTRSRALKAGRSVCWTHSSLRRCRSSARLSLRRHDHLVRVALLGEEQLAVVGELLFAGVARDQREEAVSYKHLTLPT